MYYRFTPIDKKIDRYTQERFVIFLTGDFLEGLSLFSRIFYIMSIRYLYLSISVALLQYGIFIGTIYLQIKSE
jgi:hypothetical protein